MFEKRRFKQERYTKCVGPETKCVLNEASRLQLKMPNVCKYSHARAYRQDLCVHGCMIGVLL